MIAVGAEFQALLTVIAIIAFALGCFAVGYWAGNGRVVTVEPVLRPEEVRGIEQALTKVLEETGSRSAAIFDGQGLLIASVGDADHEETGALVGIVAGVLRSSRQLGLFRTQCVSLQDERGSLMCCLRFGASGAPGQEMILATCGATDPRVLASPRTLARIAGALA